LATLLLITSCGVKSRPTPPEGTSIPTYADYFKYENGIKNGATEEDEEKKEQSK
jgi:hypothetical protein